MRTGRTVLCCLILACAHVLHADAPIVDLIIPAVISAPGANGSNWKTDVWMTNHNDAAATVDLYYAQGTVPSAPTATVTVGAHQSTTLHDVVATTLTAPGTSGVLILRTAPALVDRLQVTASAYNLQADGGIAGSGYAALRTDEFIATNKSGVTHTALDASNYRDNLGITAGPNGARVSIDIVNKDGKQTRSTNGLQGDIILAPYQHLQDSLKNLLGIFPLMEPIDAVGMGFEAGRVDVGVPATSDGSITWYLSEIDNRSNAPTTRMPVTHFPGIDAIFAGHPIVPSYVVAGVGATSGQFGTQWRTDVSVTSLAPGGQVVTFTYDPQAQDNSAHTVTISFGEGETRAFPNIVHDSFGMTGIGALRITGELRHDLLVTARTYNTTANGTYGVGITAEDASNATSATFDGNGKKTAQVDRAVNNLTQNEQFRTNLGLVNLGDTTASVMVTAFGPDGTQLGTRTDTLGPHGNVQYGLRAFTPLPVENAYAIVRCDQPVIVHAYRVNNTTGQNDNIAGFPLVTTFP